MLHLFLNTLPVFFRPLSRFQLILELHDLHLSRQLKTKVKNRQRLYEMPQMGPILKKIKYLNFSKFGAFFLVHFRHLGFHIGVIPHGVEVALIVL